MADGTIPYVERYLAILCGHLHKKYYDYHVIQVEKTLVLMDRDSRSAGCKSYMVPAVAAGYARTPRSCCTTISRQGM